MTQCSHCKLVTMCEGVCIHCLRIQHATPTVPAPDPSTPTVDPRTDDEDGQLDYAWSNYWGRSRPSRRLDQVPGFHRGEGLGWKG